jgi:hypothetical protein
VPHSSSLKEVLNSPSSTVSVLSSEELGQLKKEDKDIVVISVREIFLRSSLENYSESLRSWRCQKRKIANIKMADK